MALELRTKDVIAALVEADQRAKEGGPALAAEHSEWAAELVWLLEPGTPLTYFPVLLVCLVARSKDSSVDVRRIQPGDQYSASLVGRAVVEYGREHQIDVRTDSTNVMNSQPFIRQPAITAELSPTAAYARFYQLVDQVQDMTSEEAVDVLGLALMQGRANWPQRRRRIQRNQVHAAPQLPIEALPDETKPCFILAPANTGEAVLGETFEFGQAGTTTRHLIESNGGRFVLFQRGSDAGASRFVGAGRLVDVEEAGFASGGPIWHARVEDFVKFVAAVDEVAAALPGWNRQRLVARIAPDDFERILRLGASPEPPGSASLTVDALRVASEAEGIQLPDHVLASLVAALGSGKNVILTGPPGTAKTSLAVLVGRLAAANGLCAPPILTTATADWSTYDTIGGLAPRSDGTLGFRFGTFLQALDQNRWLIVDEMNRSNFDRAFGPLFTVLSGQDVVLQHEFDAHGAQAREARQDDADEGSTPRLVRIRMESHAEDERFHDVVLRESWRMIGTINNFDKSLLFEMSFALMRRFAFVEVPAPEDEVYLRLASSALEGEAPDVAGPALAVVTALLPLRGIKEIGPAVYLDAARMARSMLAASSLSSSEVALRVFYALLLPQFEGLEEVQGKRLLHLLRPAIAGHEFSARRMLREVLGLELRGSAQGLEDAPAVDLAYERGLDLDVAEVADEDGPVLIESGDDLANSK